MAGVAKWLRQWIVTPLLAGSSPVIRPLNCLIVYHGSIELDEFYFWYLS